MASLHPGVYFFVGALTTAVSLLIENLQIFLLAGVVFFVLGILGVLSRRKPSARQNYAAKTRDMEVTFRRCMVCGTKNHNDANFCGHCGHKLS